MPLVSESDAVPSGRESGGHNRRAATDSNRRQQLRAWSRLRPAPPCNANWPGSRPRRRLQKKRELKKKKIEEQKIKAFRDYFDYREEIKKIPPHRVLAINRGERARVLRVRLDSDLQAMVNVLDEMLVPPEHPHADYLRGCARDALTRLILPSLERDIRRELTDRAETHAVGVFAKNLRNLLLAAAGPQPSRSGGRSRLQERLQAGRARPVRQPAGPRRDLPGGQARPPRGGQAEGAGTDPASINSPWWSSATARPAATPRISSPS